MSMDKKNILTYEGLQKLEAELQDLKVVRRKEVAQKIKEAREQERAELHRTIWGIANDLRGSVDGWDFKQYVLGMLSLFFP